MFARRGISLLEVLVSIGVLTVGLLLLGTLLPVGYFHNAQAEQADRSADCAKAAFRDIEAHEMLKVEHWLWEPTSGWPNQLPPYPQPSPARPYANASSPPQMHAANPYVHTFMLDPNGVVANSQTPGASRLFPFVGSMRMRRYTLAYLRYGLPDPNNGGVRQLLNGFEAEAAADQLFTCQDDVSMGSAGQGRPNLIAEMNPNNGQLTGRTSIEGHYTWMAMVSPSASENRPPVLSGRPLKSPVPLSHRRLFNVAVIVMHKRVSSPTASPPSEQQVQVRRILGPRAIELEAVQDPITPNQVQIPITANQWIMLSAELQPPAGESPPLRRWLYRWYRVISVGRDEAQPKTVRLNLAGPVWNTAILQGPSYATFVNKVVGVFQRSIELDIRSLTSL